MGALGLQDSNTPEGWQYTDRTAHGHPRSQGYAQRHGEKTEWQ